MATPFTCPDCERVSYSDNEENRTCCYCSPESGMVRCPDCGSFHTSALIAAQRAEIENLTDENARLYRELTEYRVGS